MRILFDHDTPRTLRSHLQGHTVHTAEEVGWARLRNGDLIANAEHAAYDVLLTCDQKMRYQQNISRRQIAVVVLLSNRWPQVRLKSEEIRTALEVAKPGEFLEVPI